MNETNQLTSADESTDIRKHLAELPPDLFEQVHHMLKHDTIERVGKVLWKAGVGIESRYLYEYRKTLFPPDAMVDPYTAGPPVLRETPAPPATDNEPLPTDNGHLLNDLRDVIKRYVVLPELAAETLALWVVHTYAFTLRPVTTYIGVVSPEKRCGKTTLLEVLRRLANNALAASNISPPALFRVIQESQPTLLIDEADTFLQGRDELAGILNAGYRRDNAFVVRVADRKKGTELAHYSCWCPKVLAAIGRLPDTLADRCIVITNQSRQLQCKRAFPLRFGGQR